MTDSLEALDWVAKIDWYTMWFKDGSGREMFMDKDVDDYAKRFDFDAQELRSQGEVDFIDEYGDIVGGVFKDKIDD